MTLTSTEMTANVITHYTHISDCMKHPRDAFCPDVDTLNSICLWEIRAHSQSLQMSANTICWCSITWSPAPPHSSLKDRGFPTFHSCYGNAATRAGSVCRKCVSYRWGHRKTATCAHPLLTNIQELYITARKFVIIMIYERSFFCSPTLHLFDQVEVWNICTM